MVRGEKRLPPPAPHDAPHLADERGAPHAPDVNVSSGEPQPQDTASQAVSEKRVSMKEKPSIEPKVSSSQEVSPDSSGPQVTDVTKLDTERLSGEVALRSALRRELFLNLVSGLEFNELLRKTVQLGHIGIPITARPIRTPDVRLVDHIPSRFNLLDIGGEDGILVTLKDEGVESFSTTSELVLNLLNAHDRVRRENEIILLDPPTRFVDGCFIVDPQIAGFDIGEYRTMLWRHDQKLRSLVHSLTVRYDERLSVGGTARVFGRMLDAECRRAFAEYLNDGKTVSLQQLDAILLHCSEGRNSVLRFRADINMYAIWRPVPGIRSLPLMIDRMPCDLALRVGWISQLVMPMIITKPIPQAALAVDVGVSTNRGLAFAWFSSLDFDTHTEAELQAILLAYMCPGYVHIEIEFSHQESSLVNFTLALLARLMFCYSTHMPICMITDETVAIVDHLIATHLLSTGLAIRTTAEIDKYRPLNNVVLTQKRSSCLEMLKTDDQGRGWLNDGLNVRVSPVPPNIPYSGIESRPVYVSEFQPGPVPREFSTDIGADWALLQRVTELLSLLRRGDAFGLQHYVRSLGNALSQFFALLNEYTKLHYYTGARATISHLQSFYEDSARGRSLRNTIPVLRVRARTLAVAARWLPREGPLTRETPVMNQLHAECALVSEFVEVVAKYEFIQDWLLRRGFREWKPSHIWDVLSKNDPKSIIVSCARIAFDASYGGLLSEFMKLRSVDDPYFSYMRKINAAILRWQNELFIRDSFVLSEKVWRPTDAEYLAMAEAGNYYITAWQGPTALMRVEELVLAIKGLRIIRLLSDRAYQSGINPETETSRIELPVRVRLEIGTGLRRIECPVTFDVDSIATTVRDSFKFRDLSVCLVHAKTADVGRSKLANPDALLSSIGYRVLSYLCGDATEYAVKFSEWAGQRYISDILSVRKQCKILDYFASPDGT